MVATFNMGFYAAVLFLSTVVAVSQAGPVPVVLWHGMGNKIKLIMLFYL